MTSVGPVFHDATDDLGSGDGGKTIASGALEEALKVWSMSRNKWSTLPVGTLVGQGEEWAWQQDYRWFHFATPEQ